MNRSVEELSERLGYSFKNPELLKLAFRHASYVNEQGDMALRDNERLEFLGDAVLDLAVTHLLMDLFQDAQEGELSKYRATLVDEGRLSELASDLQLGEYLLLGKGEEQSNGREKRSILADTAEALFGAIYLDGGFDRALEVIGKVFAPFLKKVGTEEMLRDYKSLIQEYVQQTHQMTPRYRLVSETGPSHDKSFQVALTIDGKVLGKGEGKSKKDAEQKAAKEAFLCLTREQGI